MYLPNLSMGVGRAGILASYPLEGGAILPQFCFDVSDCEKGRLCPPGLPHTVGCADPTPVGCFDTPNCFKSQLCIDISLFPPDIDIYDQFVSCGGPPPLPSCSGLNVRCGINRPCCPTDRFGRRLFCDPGVERCVPVFL